MKRQLFTRCTSVCRLMIIALAVGLINLTVNAQVNIQGVAPVMIPNGGFGVDGDAMSNFPAASPYTNSGDWFSSASYPGSGGTIFNMATTADPFDFINELVSPQIMAIHYNDPYSGIDPTTFTSSNKINDNPATYTWGPASAGSPPKNEINNATVAFVYGNPALGGDADDLWAIVAGDRMTTTGSSYIDFEFLQNSLTKTGTTSGGFTTNGPHGGRTLGDVLVTIEFINGGVVAVVVINKWSSVNGSYIYVQQDNNNYVGDIFCTSNTVEVVAPWIPFGNASYQINQFAEAAVNLSTIFNFDENSCGAISTVFVRTRSSGNSSQSELKDLPGEPFQVNIDFNDLAINCPQSVTLPFCSSISDINTAYTNWRNGFSYSGGIGTVITNIATLPVSLPSTANCGYTITFEYQVYDQCVPEPLTCSSTFTVTPDNIAPVISTTAVSGELGCNPTITPPVFTGLDNCAGVFTPDVNTTGPSNVGCAYTQTWTATYTDYCLNEATPVSITYTWTVDTEDPVISTIASSGDLGCNPTSITAPEFTGLDNCAGIFTPVVNTTGPSNVGCAYTQTWTATYTDYCLNEATPVSITYTWTVDTEDPVISTLASSGDLGCNPTTITAPEFTGLDNCAGIFTPVVNTTGPSNVGCAYTQTWTATYTDYCLNEATPVSITYTWTVDTEDPVISTLASSGDLGCNPTTITAPEFTGLDNCAGIFTPVVNSTGPSNVGCAYTQTWTATYTDYCLNEATPVSITYTWTVDTEDPVISTMASSGDLGCNPTTITAPEFTGLDNCAGIFTPVVNSTGPSNVGCAYTQTWTATYTDYCLNEATPVSITYTWTVDIEDPVISTMASSGDLGCNPTTITAPEFTGLDNCTGIFTPVVNTTGPSNVGCAYTQTWTATYTDYCLNEATPVSITYTWTVDTEDPVISTMASSGDLGCNPTTITAPEFTGLDNCAGIFTPVVNTTRPSNVGCAYTQTWTATYTDYCLNEATQVSITYTWTVDTEDPQFTNLPTGGDLGCDPILPSCDNSVTAIDNCSNAVVDCTPGVIVVDGIMSTQTFTYTATDDCENVTEQTITYTWTTSCGDDYCTLTQGFYGNSGGLYCTGETTSQLLDRLLTTNLVVGQGNRKFTIKAGYDQCVIDLLPAGGPSEVLPIGNWSCTNLGTLVTPTGELKNSLLAQTITLGLNLRLDTDLGSLRFTSPDYYTLASSSCDGENPVALPGTETYYTGSNGMPMSVMNKFGGDPTVQEIYTLANQALGNVNTGVPLGDITKALGNINDGLDECRFIYFLPVLQSAPISNNSNDEQSKISLSVSPNPFSDETSISYSVIKDSRVSLELYNMQGMKVSTLFEGNVLAGDVNNINLIRPQLAEQMLMVVLKTDNGILTKKIIMIHK